MWDREGGSGGGGGGGHFCLGERLSHMNHHLLLQFKLIAYEWLARTDVFALQLFDKYLPFHLYPTPLLLSLPNQLSWRPNGKYTRLQRLYIEYLKQNVGQGLPHHVPSYISSSSSFINSFFLLFVVYGAIYIYTSKSLDKTLTCRNMEVDTIL